MGDTNCIFCKIVSGSIPSTIVYEDDLVIGFLDVQPIAPTHILLVPKAHNLKSLDDVNSSNTAVIAHIFSLIPKIAQKQGIAGGYRVVTNCGEGAGQTVMHLHFHIIGGRKLHEMG